MRQFIVLGYSSNNTKDPGKCLYLGTDLGKAMEKVNEHGKHARRELFELASPQIRRSFTSRKSAPAEKTGPEAGQNDGDQGKDKQ